MFYVYILLCSDGTYYTGITNNLLRRFSEHENGTNYGSYTYSRRPLKLVFSAVYTSPLQAIKFEKKIKKWSKAKKEALINGNYFDLPRLSKKVFRK